MDDKIKQLERYNEVTTQIISEDIDSVGELLDERQQIIAAMDGISLDIKQFVNDQSIERRDKINALLNFEDIGELNGELQLLAAFSSFALRSSRSFLIRLNAIVSLLFISLRSA